MNDRIREIRVYKEHNGTIPFIKWLKDQPQALVEEFNDRLVYIENELHWEPQYIKKLTGKKHKDLWEVRIKFEKQQYRMFFFLGPGRKEITFLAGAKKKQNKYSPTNVLDTSLKRLNEARQPNRTDDYPFE